MGLFELNATFRSGMTADGMEPDPEVNDKESARWLRGLDRAQELAAVCPGTRVVNIFGGEQQPVQGVLPVGRFGGRHREHADRRLACGGLRRRQHHFGGADVDVHCALFAGALATARGQFQRLRRQWRLPGEVLPQIRFPSVLEDHLPLRRTAGAHQQPGAVGCRLA